MMKAVYKFVITAIFLVSVSFVHANGLTSLSLKDGIAGVSIMDFHEDKSGLMWIGTSNGINLYDGINILTYKLKNEETGDPVLVYQLTHNEQGTIYAATNAGIFILRVGNNDFHRICPDIHEATCILSNQGKIYIGNRLGIFAIDENNYSKIKNINKNALESNNSVRGILADKQGNIWFTTRYHINRYTPSSGHTIRYHIPEPTGLRGFAFCAGKIFIGSSTNGIYIVSNSLKGKWRKLNGDFYAIRNIKGDSRHNCLYIATDGAGAYTVDGKTEKVIEHFGIREVGIHHLSTDAVINYCTDSNGNRWIGTFRNGLFHTNNQQSLLQTYQLPGFTTNGIDIMSYLIQKDHIYLGTNGGFYVIDRRSQKASYHSTAQWGMYLIKGIIEYQGEIYICSLGHGMKIYNPVTQQIHEVPNCPLLSNAAITTCVKNTQGELWVASSAGIFQFNGNQVKMYNDNNSRLYGGVKSIAFDKDNNVWFCTMQGLCIYIRKDNSVKNSDFPKDFKNVERMFLKAGNGKIYAFNLNKIYYTNASMTDYGELPLPKGILDETCTDLLPDNKGQLWMVTERGLFLYNPTNGMVTHIGNDPSLTFQNINTRTMSISPDDKLWIGTSDGLKYIDLQKLKAYCKDAHPLISLGKVNISNQSVDRGTFLQIARNHQVEISWNILSQSIEIFPHAIGTSSDNSNVYEYRLDNKGEWQQTTCGKIGISKLSLGHHKLQLRIAGIQHITEYGIFVKPSWLVWLELALAIGTIVVIIMWKRYVKNTRAIINEHQETEKALIEEYHASLPSPEKEQAQEQERKKYAKSRQDQKELAKIAHSMELYIKKEKPYLNAELKMSDIAAQIQVSPSKLSQVFSLYLNMSYYDYINQFRLTEFKRLIAQKLHKKLTVTAISEQCGFKKTSFFSTFRKLEGMTPTEYIQKQ